MTNFSVKLCSKTLYIPAHSLFIFCNQNHDEKARKREQTGKGKGEVSCKLLNNYLIFVPAYFEWVRGFGFLRPGLQGFRPIFERTNFLPLQPVYTEQYKLSQ